MTATVRRGIRSLLVAMAVAVAATFTLGQPAHASESAQPSTSDVEVLLEVTQLPSGALAITDLATKRTSYFDPHQEGRLTTGVPSSDATTAASPIARCGVESYGPGGFFKRPYCDVTRTGQRMAAAGSIASLATAICVATSGVLCVVAVGAATALGVYIDEHGLCPGNARVGYQVYFSIRCL